MLNDHRIISMDIYQPLDSTPIANNDITSLEEWLAERGLEKYADCFERAGAVISLLPCLTEQDLLQMGVSTIGARKKILLGASEMQTEKLKVESKLTTGPLAFFQKSCKTPSSKWVHADQKKSSLRMQSNTKKASKTFYPFMNWQLVPGTDFVVDRFNSLPPTATNYHHWFLTHFHADHYKGLTSKYGHIILVYA